MVESAGEHGHGEAMGAQVLAGSGGRRGRRRVSSASRPGGALPDPAPGDALPFAARAAERARGRTSGARTLARAAPHTERPPSSGSVEILLPPEVLLDPEATEAALRRLAPEGAGASDVAVPPEAGLAGVALSLSLAAGALLVSGGFVALRGEPGAGGALVTGGAGVTLLALIALATAARARAGLTFALASLLALLDLAFTATLFGFGG